MNPIRFGLIGAGQISHSGAAGINNHPEAKVVAAQDINADRVKALCEAQKIDRTYTDAAELFADPEIDAVYIAVPNSLHVPLTIQALEAGKHVILEKPFAMSYAEAETAAAAATKAGKVLTLGMNQRFINSVQSIKSLVQKGALGEVYHAKASWMRRTGIPRLGTWFGNRALAGGGCLNDIGVHALDACLYVLGNFDAVTVSGSTYTKFGNRGLGEGGWGHSDRNPDIVFDVDDFASGFIRLSNGCSVTLDVSWAAHAEEANRAEVELYGTEAGAHVFAGKLFRFGEEGYEVVQGVKGDIAFPHGNRFHNFINHLLGKEELCVTVEQALKVQRILDGIAESAACGREVQLA